MRRVTAITEKKPYVVEISTEEHRWTADEPPSKGGEDVGPSPFELLLSAVGACMMITARMYAERKSWPLDSMKADLEYSRIRAEDCDDCGSKTGFISQITIRMSLQGNLDESQRQRIFEIAGRCPVKRSLEGEVKIRSQLQD
jgi:putative redox protein